MPRLYSALLAAALLFSPAAGGQQTTVDLRYREGPLTNAGIIQMLQAGLPEETIALAIRQAAQRGTARLSDSAAALIALRQAGASSAILNEVVRAADPRGVFQPAGPRLDDITGLPRQPGVYIRVSEGWMNLTPVLASPRLGFTGAIGPGSTEVSLRLPSIPYLPGIDHSRPVFYVVGLYPPGGQPYLIAPVGPRESGEVIGHTESWTRLLVKQDVIQMDFQRLEPDVVVIRPIQPLRPGRYAVITAWQPNQQWLLNASQFQIL